MRVAPRFARRDWCRPRLRGAGKTTALLLAVVLLHPACPAWASANSFSVPPDEGGHEKVAVPPDGGEYEIVAEPPEGGHEEAAAPYGAEEWGNDASGNAVTPGGELSEVPSAEGDASVEGSGAEAAHPDEDAEPTASVAVRTGPSVVERDGSALASARIAYAQDDARARQAQADEEQARQAIAVAGAAAAVFCLALACALLRATRSMTRSRASGRRNNGGVGRPVRRVPGETMRRKEGNHGRP